MTIDSQKLDSNHDIGTLHIYINVLYLKKLIHQHFVPDPADIMEIEQPRRVALYYVRMWSKFQRSCITVACQIWPGTCHFPLWGLF